MAVVVCLVPYQISAVQAWFRCLPDAIAGGGGAPYQMGATGRAAHGQLGRLLLQLGLLLTGWGFSALITLRGHGQPMFTSIDLKFES